MSDELQLDREVKLLTQEPSKSNHCIACRYNYFRKRYLRDLQESAEDVSEDQVNVTISVATSEE
jgi:hypothetical protein